MLSNTLNPDVTLKVGLDSVKLNLGEDFKVTQGGLIDSPTHYAYLLVLKNKALRAYHKVREQKDKAYFTLFSIIQGEGEDNRFPISDRKIEAEIAEDKEYIKLRRRVLTAKANYELCSDMAEAFKVAIEIRRTLSANKRAELNQV